MSDEKIVMCMRWGTLYPTSYVNVLYSAVRKNLTGPFRFVCLTNEPEGLAEGIEHFPIPEIGLKQENWYHGAWPKLGVFQHDLYGLKGRCLFIDLDSAVVSSLDPFFATPGTLITIDGGPNWHPNHGTGPATCGTGVFAYDLGTLGHILDRFAQNPEGEIATFELEQAFVQDCVPDVAFWPGDWVISFKRHMRRPALLEMVLPPKSPPATAKIIAFHGSPRPVELVRPGIWGKFPHIGRGPVGWMRRYWIENGGPEA